MKSKFLFFLFWIFLDPQKLNGAVDPTVLKDLYCTQNGMISDGLDLFDSNIDVLPGGDSFLNVNSDPGRLSRMLETLGNQVSPTLISTEKLRTTCLSSDQSIRLRRKKRFAFVPHLIALIMAKSKTGKKILNLPCGVNTEARIEGKVNQIGERMSKGFLHIGNKVDKANVGIDSLQCMMAGGMEYWAEIHKGQDEMTNLLDTRTADIQKGINDVTNLVDVRATEITADWTS